VTVYLDGSDAPDRDEEGNAMTDEDLLLLVNGWSEPIDFVVPRTRPAETWIVELDSAGVPTLPPAGVPLAERARVSVPGYSLVVMRSDALEAAR
jgi:glycogen operon protein